VRTTIRLDDLLYREAKARAARAGRTVAAVLEDAIRVGLHGSPGDGVPTHRFEVTASGRGGLRPGVDLTSSASVAEALDADPSPSLDALR
jgi:hypothetical protein